MTALSPQSVTQLLKAWGNGEQQALDRLISLVYAELHRLAYRYMRRERSGHTLQPTALVHEAYERLVDLKNVSWQNRAHFFGVSAQLMRRILVDYARSRRYTKREGQWRQVPLNEAVALFHDRQTDIVALDDAFTSNIRGFATDQNNFGEILGRNRGALGNVVFRPRSDLVLSAEFRRLRTFPVYSNSSTLNQVNLSVGILF